MGCHKMLPTNLILGASRSDIDSLIYSNMFVIAQFYNLCKLDYFGYSTDFHQLFFFHIRRSN